MNQQPPYEHQQPYPQNLAKSEQYYSYSKNMLALLNIGCIASLVLFIVPSILFNDTTSGHTVQSTWLGSLSSIGGIILFVEIVCVMIFDWRGAVTLRGMVKAQAIRKGKLVSTSPRYVLLYLFLPEIMLPIYLVRTTKDHHQAKLRRPLERQHQIAAMEAQLGILPPTEGTCRACQKVLQVGAEFCQYCGVPVVVRPKICPACATTALPDANWCPNCRTRLS